jgi:hypothetical protein
MPLTSSTVSPSTNPAGDATTLHDGPRSKAGAGAETVVVVNLYGYVNAQANGMIASWLPHYQQSSATVGGHCGAAVVQGLWAVDPNHIGYGMEVHPQSGFYMEYSKGGTCAPWKTDGWTPPLDNLGRPQGPDIVEVPTPATPPNPDDRIANNEEDLTPQGKPTRKQ